MWQKKSATERANLFLHLHFPQCVVLFFSFSSAVNVLWRWILPSRLMYSGPRHHHWTAFSFFAVWMEFVRTCKQRHSFNRRNTRVLLGSLFFWTFWIQPCASDGRVSQNLNFPFKGIFRSRNTFPHKKTHLSLFQSWEFHSMEHGNMPMWNNRLLPLHKGQFLWLFFISGTFLKLASQITSVLISVEAARVSKQPNL